MSVLVKNMKIPEKGHIVSLVITSEGEAICANSRTKIGEVIELPEKHGRLIDADELSKRIEEQQDTEYATNNKPRGTWKRVLELPLNMISDAPTIIEAEEGK